MPSRHRKTLAALTVLLTACAGNIAKDGGGTLRAIFILMALLVAMVLSACTTEQAYYTAQGWKRNQCNKLPDKAEFDRCMSNTNAAYESYKRGEK